MRRLQHAMAAGLLLAVGMGGAGSVYAQDSTAEKLLNERCGSCHARLPEGGLSRVHESRRTPEGWDMTIARMMFLHGVPISAEERGILVKHLADTQGMAPAETANWRYILERQPNVVETPEDEQLAVMCGRCHSYARLAIQRRDEGEWQKLVHFHLGQFPTIEYQALGRDRNWWDIASTEMPALLAKHYPLTTDAWKNWQAQAKADLSGTWRVVGQRPGKGRYTGTLSLSRDGSDSYNAQMELVYADGSTVSGSGKGMIYTGYEWRGRLNLDGTDTMQVFALSEDGNTLSGRWFLADDDALGGQLKALRSDADSTVLAVEPPYLHSGATATLTLHGVGLPAEGDITLGDGVEVVSVSSRSPEQIVVEVKAADTATSGSRSVKIGDLAGANLVTVYEQIDAVRVEPAVAIARVGGAGGPVDPVPAQFDAVAYLNGADGTAGTDDDIRIGAMPATWTMDNANDAAAKMEDTKYAGQLSDVGLFMPAGAGLNPERPFQTNNAGELTIKAAVDDQGRNVEGSARLVVTVQRWNDPPIR